jgi:hypothetical protein
MIDIGKIVENKAHKYLYLYILQITTTAKTEKQQTRNKKKPTTLENKDN